MTGGTCFLLLPEFYGWFDGKPRHFWFPKLTYENKDTQSLVRSSWVVGILLLIIGSVVYVMASSQTLMLNFLRVAYWLIATWILLKLVLLVSDFFFESLNIHISIFLFLLRQNVTFFFKIRQ